jgi:hypothetical protein
LIVLARLAGGGLLLSAADALCHFLKLLNTLIVLAWF